MWNNLPLEIRTGAIITSLGKHYNLFYLLVISKSVLNVNAVRLRLCFLRFTVLNDAPWHFHFVGAIANTGYLYIWDNACQYYSFLQIGVVVFSTNAHTPSGKLETSACYSSHLAKAIPENKEYLNEYISYITEDGSTNYGKALEKAFTLIRNTPNEPDEEKRSKSFNEKWKIIVCEISSELF